MAGGTRAGGPRVCLGVVVGAHGIEGLLRVKPFTAEPDAVAAYGPVEAEPPQVGHAQVGRAQVGQARTLTLTAVGAAKGVVLVRAAGVADRNGAEALRGFRLYVPRAALPPPDEEEYYHADLVGLVAQFRDGTRAGRVRAVHDFGAGDTLEIAGDDGRSLMLPFTRAAVPVVDVAGGVLVVDPPPGLLPGGGREDTDEDGEDGEDGTGR